VLVRLDGVDLVGAAGNDEHGHPDAGQFAPDVFRWDGTGTACRQSG
jgi:hypothetical protein